MRLTQMLSNQPPAGLYLLCGPPASGKTFFRHTWWTGNVLSPDDLRLAMLGTAFDPRREGVVWLRVRQQAERELGQGRAVLLDATAVSRAARRPWVQLARKAGRQAYALAAWDPAVTPGATLLERNRRRETPVPDDRLQAMIKAWQPPAASEGFVQVWTLFTCDGGAVRLPGDP